MSQSSNSGRPLRKRKTRPESPDLPTISTKRRRGRLSLKSSGRSNVSTPEVKEENNTLECSVITISSSEDPQFPHSSIIANQYGISTQMARKYYSILSNPPKLPIFRLSVFKTESSPEGSPNGYQMSPEIGFRKRQRKPKRKTENPKQSVNRKRNVNEGSSNLYSSKRDGMTSGTSSSQLLLSQAQKCYQTSYNSSSDEFDTKKSAIFSQNRLQGTKDLVSNPYSQAKKSSNVINSIWSWIASSSDPIKKKMILKNFEKRPDFEEKSFKYFSVNKNVKRKKIIDKRRKRLSHLKEEGSSSMADCSDICTEDSMYANCQMLSLSTINKVDKSVNTDSSIASLPLPFGYDTYDQEKKVQKEKVPKKKQKNNIQINKNKRSHQKLNVQTEKVVIKKERVNDFEIITDGRSDQEQDVQKEKVIEEEKQKNNIEMDSDERSYQEQRNTNTLFDDDESNKSENTVDESNKSDNTVDESNKSENTVDESNKSENTVDESNKSENTVDESNKSENTVDEGLSNHNRNSSTVNNNNEEKNNDLDSLNIYESSLSQDSKSPDREKINTSSNQSGSENSKSRAKPKIINDKLLKNIYLKGETDMQSSLRNSIGAFVESNGVAKMNSKNNLNSIEPKSNGTNCNSMSSAITPKARGTKPNLSQLKMNLNNDESVRNYQMNNSVEHIMPEESFESICQDLTQLLTSENITLHKGEENDAETEVVKIADTKILPNCNNNTNEEVSSIPSVSTKSPNSQKSPLFSLSFKRKTPEHTSSKASNSPNSQNSQLLVRSQNGSPMTPQRKISQNVSPCVTSNQSQQNISPAVFQLNRPQKLSPQFSSSSPQKNLDIRKTSPLIIQQNTPPKFDLNNQQTFYKTEKKSPLKQNTPLEQNTPPKFDSNNQQTFCKTEESPMEKNSFHHTYPVLVLSPQVKQSLRIPHQNKSPRLNQDPRLNRTIGLEHVSSTPGRDPRLNKSFDSGKVSDAIVTDPRLIRGNSRPLGSSKDATLLSQEKAKDESTKIVDPRLRKRKEREEAERAAKLSQQLDMNPNDIRTPLVTPEIPMQESAALASKRASSFEIDKAPVEVSPTNSKRKASVFARLGTKLQLPVSSNEDTSIVKNDCLDGIKSRSSSPTNSVHSDDGISIFAGDIFSSDEESNSSPRHRKFIPERLRQNEEMNLMQPRQSLSIKDRLNNRRPLITDNTPSNNITASKPTRLPVKSRIGFKVNPQQQQQQQQQQNSSTSNRKPPNAHERAMQSTSKVREEVDASISNILKSTDYENEGFNNEFIKMNTEQMMQDVDNIQILEDESNYVTFGSKDIPTKYDFVSLLEGNNVKVNPGLSKDTKLPFFKNICHRQLRRGHCANQQSGCHFKHQINFLQRTFINRKDNILEDLYFAIKNGFEYFLLNVWGGILPKLKDDLFTVFEKIYHGNMRTNLFIKDLLSFCLESKLCTLETFVKKLSIIVDQGDRDMVRFICVAIKNELIDGFCWETIKDLCQKAVPPYDMIELTLLQCLRRKKNQTHLREVYDLVTNKIEIDERNRMDQSLLTKFYKLVQQTGIVTIGNDKTPNTIPLSIPSDHVKNTQSLELTRNKSIESIKSMDSEPTAQGNSVTNLVTVKQPNNSPVEILSMTPQRGEVIMTYNVKELDNNPVDTSAPKSVHRKRYWKFYLRVASVTEGLKNKDYDHVWKELDDFSHESVPNELLRRAYYQILCKDIKNCDKHLIEVIKRAVWSRRKSKRSLDTLFDVGVYALINLGDDDRWILALELLNWVKILEPDELRTEFVIISAEIYLANNDPIEALYLLQRTKLIKTNRDEWLVEDSLKEHEKHRNELVFLLLKGLSFVDLDKAVYLFKALLADQYIYYYPIDLTAYLDKLLLLTLIHEKDDLAIDLSRLVMNNDLTFQKPTYQELISYILPRDEVLANQILDYAVHLGYYTDIQIRDGFTTMIIDTNYYEEEVYLMMKRMIHKLVLAIGPAIPHLKPNQLKIYLVLEDIPDEKRLYRNNITDLEQGRYKKMRKVVENILATRFSPQIKPARNRSHKYVKLVSRSVVDYLQHWN